MRKILFRGKSKDGHWNYGNLVHMYCKYRGIVETEVWKIHPVQINGADYPTIVDPETVGQFTGLFDKNGKGIYEGDIVTSESFGDPFAVEFVENEYWGAFCAIEGGRENGSCYPLSEFSTGTGLLSCEVIGNIHDNPELLEGSEDGR